MSFSDGYTATPYRKPSRKKTPKKGTGKGVCQVTGKKHIFGKIGYSGPYQYTINGEPVGNGIHLTVYTVCGDCFGYKYTHHMRSDDTDTLLADFRERYGMKLRDAVKINNTMKKVK